MKNAGDARRHLAIVAAIAVAVSLTGCSGTSPLRVATSGDYPPFSSKTPYGAIVGFDATVAAQFAPDSRHKMYFVLLRWPQLDDQALADEFDVAMSGVTIRADRVPYMFFSRPYAVTGAVVVVRRERAEELGTLAQIDRLGVRIAVNRGGHLERIARDRFTKAKVLTVDDNRMLSDLVLRGEVDAAVSDQLEVSAWGVDAFAVIGPFTRDRKAYAVPAQHIEVLQQLNDWMTAREKDGWLNDVRRRWLGEPAVWSPEQACFEAIAAAIDLRMQLMPQVAAAKRQQNLPIEDPAQEERVRAQVVEWATAAGVEPTAAVALFERLIVAAKAVQRASQNEKHDALMDANLDSLRSAIGFYSRRIIDEAAGCQAALKSKALRPALEAALRGGDGAAMQNLLPAAEVATLLASLDRTAAPLPVSNPADAEPESPTGSYVEFCVPPNMKFDRQGYAAEPLVNGEPIAEVWSRAAVHYFRSGRTRVPTTAGRREYWIYVSGSSADPHVAGGSRTPPTTVAIDIAANSVVGIRFTPILRAAGAFELRWVDAPGGVQSEFSPYHGVTRFDVETEVYDAGSETAANRCPW